jgi:rRNA-processing protein FCF1
MVSNYIRDAENRNGYVPPSGVLHVPLEGNPSAQGQYLDLLESIPAKLVTSHVVGELNGLALKLKLYGSRRVDFWRTSRDLILGWGIQEQLVCLVDLWKNEAMRELIAEIGPTDAGLLDLALERNCVLITEDEKTLAARAWKLAIECQLVRNLVPAP